jgi:UDP-N-acetylglucosamine 1-carboxyvinyltransferase
MQKLVIQGKNKLFGDVKISGAKNASLPILAATLMISDEVYLHNCPSLSDTAAAIRILRHLGSRVTTQNQTICVNSKDATAQEIPDTLMHEMRSSIIFLGAMLTRFNCAQLSLPGGCELGPRPIDLHLDALSQMGVKTIKDGGTLRFSAPNGLNGAKIQLSIPSVGATENIILAATKANGVTEINNAAREPEIVDLSNFLRSCGAKIKGDGSDCVIIQGVEKLTTCEHTIIPDRIEAATFMAASAITGGELLITNLNENDLKATNSFFTQLGCHLKSYDGSKIFISAPQKLNCPKTVVTTYYPGFPTDVQAIAMAVTTLCQGTSVFVENIFQNRYKHASELTRMGANIKTHGRVAVVEGVKTLSGAKVTSTDLRGGAALCVAALAAQGDSEIGDIYHIDRGYCDFENKLKNIGAKIKRC